MSDDEYYEYGPDDFYDSDEEFVQDIADHVDSLAERTMHSPIIVNAHPDFDLEYDEWEYLTDEYWDGDDGGTTKKSAPGELPSRSLKRTYDTTAEATAGKANAKRRKLEVRREDIKRRPMIIWRSKSMDNEQCVPTVRHDDGKEVVVLKNWRELLERPATADASAEAVSERSPSVNHGSVDSGTDGDTSDTLVPTGPESRQSKRRHEEQEGEDGVVDLPTGNGCGTQIPTTRNSKRIKI